MFYLLLGSLVAVLFLWASTALLVWTTLKERLAWNARQRFSLHACSLDKLDKTDLGRRGGRRGHCSWNSKLLLARSYFPLKSKLLRWYSRRQGESTGLQSRQWIPRIPRTLGETKTFFDNLELMAERIRRLIWGSAARCKGSKMSAWRLICPYIRLCCDSYFHGFSEGKNKNLGNLTMHGQEICKITLDYIQESNSTCN